VIYRVEGIGRGFDPTRVHLKLDDLRLGFGAVDASTPQGSI